MDKLWFWKQRWVYCLMIQLSCWQMVWILMFLLPLAGAFSFLQADGCQTSRKQRALVLLDLLEHVCPISTIKVFPHTQTVICLSQCFLTYVLMLLICFYHVLQLVLSLSRFQSVRSQQCYSEHIPVLKSWALVLLSCPTCSETEKPSQMQPKALWMHLLKQNKLTIVTFNNVVLSDCLGLISEWVGSVCKREFMYAILIFKYG